MTTRHRNNEHTNDYGPVERSRRFYSIRQAAWTVGISYDEMARAVRVGTVRAIRRRGALVVTADELMRHLPSPAGTGAPSTADTTENTLDELDRYRDVPTDVLARIVVAECAAPLADLDGESDVDLAERICGACRAPLACVELELRLHGADTIGVWGGLPEDAVRNLCRGWLDRRTHHATSRRGLAAESDEDREGWA